MRLKVVVSGRQEGELVTEPRLVTLLHRVTWASAHNVFVGAVDVAGRKGGKYEVFKFTKRVGGRGGENVKEGQAARSESAQWLELSDTYPGSSFSRLSLFSFHFSIFLSFLPSSLHPNPGEIRKLGQSVAQWFAVIYYWSHILHSAA